MDFLSLTLSLTKGADENDGYLLEQIRYRLYRTPPSITSSAPVT